MAPAHLVPLIPETSSLAFYKRRIKKALATCKQGDACRGRLLRIASRRPLTFVHFGFCGFVSIAQDQFFKKGGFHVIGIDTGVPLAWMLFEVFSTLRHPCIAHFTHLAVM
jgi:hypothetical protein